MRLAGLSILLLALTAACFAQDTNFAVGPQYLITKDSTLFLRPIATPSISLTAPLASISTTVSEPTAAAQTSSLPTGSPSQPDLTRIYWGGPEVNQVASGNVSEIEITSRPPLQPLPASFIDSGVTGITDVQALRTLGFGVTLGETASYWKAHKPHTNHVYTNADVQRLHGS